MRAITDEHLQAYLEGGCLQKLFNVINEDPELSFELRVKGEVMIYYHKDKIMTIRFCKGKPSVEILSEKYYKKATPPSVIYGSAQIFFLKNPLIYVISLVRVDIVYRSPRLS